MDESSNRTNQKRLFMWGLPRSRSTPFLRAMANGPKTKVFLEPYCSAYFLGPDRVNMRYKSITEPDSTFQNVTEKLEKDTYPDYDVIYVKEMSYYVMHCYGEKAFNILPKGYIHTFIIRDPREAVPSFYRNSINNECSEIGFKESWELFHILKSTTGTAPIVIESADLISHPETLLKAFCEKVGIIFHNSMVHWKDDPMTTLKTGRGWLTGWQKTTAQTSTFQDIPAEICTIPEDVNKMVEECMVYYEDLQKYVLKP